MGLTLPAMISGPAAAALGTSWPQVDEDSLDGLAATFARAADALDTHALDADRHTRGVLAASTGGLADGLIHASGALVGSADSTAATTAAELRTSSVELAADAAGVRETKVGVIDDLSTLTERLAVLHATGPLTAGGASLLPEDEVRAASRAIADRHTTLVDTLGGAGQPVAHVGGHGAGAAAPPVGTVAGLAPAVGTVAGLAPPVVSPVLDGGASDGGVSAVHGARVPHVVAPGLLVDPVSAGVLPSLPDPTIPDAPAAVGAVVDAPGRALPHVAGAPAGPAAVPHAPHPDSTGPVRIPVAADTVAAPSEQPRPGSLDADPARVSAQAAAPPDLAPPPTAGVAPPAPVAASGAPVAAHGPPAPVLGTGGANPSTGLIGGGLPAPGAAPPVVPAGRVGPTTAGPATAAGPGPAAAGPAAAAGSTASGPTAAGPTTAARPTTTSAPVAPAPTAPVAPAPRAPVDGPRAGATGAPAPGRSRASAPVGFDTVTATRAAAAAVDPSRAPAHAEPALLLLVLAFPAGTAPVRTARPARQLPPPVGEARPGLCVPPGDHPTHPDLALPTRVGHEPVAVGLDATRLLHGWDPLGGGNEVEVERRFVIRPATADRPAEHVWPPSELHPEGAVAPDRRRPVRLEVGVLLDLLGTTEGRVVAGAGTPFALRSEPAAHAERALRRLRVTRPLPAWESHLTAWFAQPGGGLRYRLTHPVAELVATGWLVDGHEVDGRDTVAHEVDGHDSVAHEVDGRDTGARATDAGQERSRGR